VIVIRQHRIFREDLKNNPKVLYIFGDNLHRTGMGGQAKEMRGEPNAFGFATKRRPSHGELEDYFHDGEADVPGLLAAEYARLVYEITTHFCPIAVVIPSDGIGTGLALLHRYAPETLKTINNMLNQLEKF